LGTNARSAPTCSTRIQRNAGQAIPVGWGRLIVFVVMRNLRFGVIRVGKARTACRSLWLVFLNLVDADRWIRPRGLRSCLANPRARFSSLTDRISREARSPEQNLGGRGWLREGRR